MGRKIQMIYNLPLVVTIDLDEREVYRVQELGDLIKFNPDEKVLEFDEDGSNYNEIEGDVVRECVAIAENSEWPVRD